ncbi:MAG: hypothetical protein ACOX0R_00380 [Candidatus Dojkabacteria bacterium]|jgi:hypothetical protein
MRDNKYLENILYDLWDNHFCDVPRKNLVVIKFGKYSKRQLGSIKLANRYTKIKGLMKKRREELEVQDEKSVTVITVTRYFQNEIVPEFVIRATIAHELCHYTHGFQSPLEKQFDHPHQGNVIKKELAKRDLLNQEKEADKWLKENWLKIVY